MDYPECFTDPEWKKLEKELKISATGVGKTLRDLEKAVSVADAGVQALSQKKTTAARVVPAMKVVADAAKKASNTVHAVKVKDPAAREKLNHLEWQLGDYVSELEHLNLNDDDLEYAVDRVNRRVKSRIGR